jgi:DNA-binding CsgD family transcriptional regulator/GAF domain-containing protein
MSILTESDFRDVMAVNEATQHHRAVADLQREILFAIEKHLAAPASMFLIRSGKHWVHDFDRAAQRGIPDFFAARYLDGPHSDDPFSIHIRENPAWRFGVTTNDAIVTAERWTSCRVYRELLQPCGMQHMLGMELVASGLQIGLVGLMRAKDAEPFSQRDVQKAALCSSAIANALDRALETEEIFQHDRHVASAVSALTGVGLAILDERLRLVYCTREARDLLDRLAGRDAAGELPPPVRRAAASLQRQVASSPVESREALEVSERFDVQGPPIDARLRCLNVARGAVRYVMTLKRAPDSICETGRLLELGLTKREADIAQLVVGGLRNADIADRLCVSINTVQTHLRSIFVKLGVRNRASLMLRVFTHDARAQAQPGGPRKPH